MREMTAKNFQERMEYLQSLDLTGIHRPIVEMGAGDMTGEVFDKAKNQALVVGSGVFSFEQGVDAEMRSAISDSALLAQLVANKKASSEEDPLRWFAAYAEVLENVGWVLQDAEWHDYTTSGHAVDVHEKILEVMAAALAPHVAALAILTATVKALSGMDKTGGWFKIFNRESQHAKVARFQIGLVSEDASGEASVTQLACLVKATDTITQVLFFKYRAAQAKFEARINKVSINKASLTALHAKILNMTRAFQDSFLSGIQSLSL
jgi:hypothetical protein